ncbi:hypothetical protein AVEN_89314-1 [Araneus ventricosus]|uniref:Uncharacterized protein n=1 Tax=Araneus ventricosus TaxID=182803 RepID=A0A4Y2FJ72_ARAVE|nr:hypothetical protein AVEN_89314-1 [Araneus ventricosus]
MASLCPHFEVSSHLTGLEEIPSSFSQLGPFLLTSKLSASDSDYCGCGGIGALHFITTGGMGKPATSNRMVERVANQPSPIPTSAFQLPSRLN